MTYMYMRSVEQFLTESEVKIPKAACFGGNYCNLLQV